MSIRILFYGILRNKYYHNKKAKLLKENATTKDSIFDLVSYGPFPGVYLHGEYKVIGDLWEVDSLEEYDMVEGYPYMYDRALVSIEGEEEPAFVYISQIPMKERLFNQSQIQIDEENKTKEWISLGRRMYDVG